MTLRLVPDDPDLTEFPPRLPAFACNERPTLCDQCFVPECPYEVQREDDEPTPAA